MTDLFQINEPPAKGIVSMLINAIASNLGGSIQALLHDQGLKNRIYSTC